MKSRLIQAFLVLTLSNTMLAQDMHFSQHYNNTLALNPANAGAFNDLQINLNFKDQWRSMGNPYKTFSLAFDKRITKGRKPNFLAAGLLLFNDQSGSILSATMGNLNVAYHIRTSDFSKISGGILCGFGQRSLNSNLFQTGSQYNGTAFDAGLSNGESFASGSTTYLDAGLGFAWTFDNTVNRNSVVSGNELKINIGGSAVHVNSPRLNLAGAAEKMGIKYTFHGKSRISVPNTNSSINPSMIFNSQGKFKEIILGAMYRVKLKAESKVTMYNKGTAISFGAHYRLKDAFIVATELEYSNFFLGLSYDLNTSDLNLASKGRGGFEMTLRFVTPNPFGGSRSRI